MRGEHWQVGDGGPPGHVHICIYIYISLSLSLPLHLYIYMYIHIFFIFIYIYTHLCVGICFCRYTCTQAETEISRHKLRLRIESKAERRMLFQVTGSQHSFVISISAKEEEAVTCRQSPPRCAVTFSFRAARAEGVRKWPSMATKRSLAWPTCW